MKTIIEKQLVEWREELASQKQKQAQARRVLEEVNQAILMIEGGIQAKESLLRKIEQESQPTGTVELGKPQGKTSSKSKA
jgi:Ni,Fe-hydrogenase I small subunit